MTTTTHKYEDIIGYYKPQMVRGKRLIGNIYWPKWVSDPIRTKNCAICKKPRSMHPTNSLVNL